MKNILSLTFALSLLAAPALAEETTATGAIAPKATKAQADAEAASEKQSDASTPSSESGVPSGEPAQAEDSPPPTEPEVPPTPTNPEDGANDGESAAPAPTEKEAKLRALYDKGVAAYARGEYTEAFRLFSETHRRSGHPALLFNMAQAKRLSGPGHCLESRRLYEAYLKQNEATPNRKEVLEKLEQLKVCAAEEEEALNQSARQREALRRMQRPVPSAAKALTFGGGILLAVGGGIFTASRIHFAQVKEECPCEPGRFSTWDTAQNVSYGLMAAGGASLLAGGSWWWIHSSRRREATGDSFTVFEAGFRGNF